MIKPVLIILIIIILITIGGVVAFFISNSKESTKCGDGICQNTERTKGTCSQDCKQESNIPSGPNAQDILFFEFHYVLQQKNPNLFTDDALVNAVGMAIPWPDIESTKGNFDFSTLDRNIDIWANAQKSVLLGFVPYGQTKGNTNTPQWVKDSVPCVKFTSKKEAIGEVTIPVVWDDQFINEYSAFIQKVAQKYDLDPRVKYIQIGIGHIGYMTAQPSTAGEQAFLNAGWTLAKWETYTKKIIDIFANNFKNKKLIITITPMFTKSYPLKDNLDVGKRIVDYAVAKNCNVLFKGVDEDATKFESTGFPDLIKYLANSNYQNLSLGFGDDWPMYGQTGSKRRNADDFAAILNNISNLWLSINKKYPLFLVVLDSELAASEKGNKNFNQQVYDSLTDFINKLND